MFFSPSARRTGHRANVPYIVLPGLLLCCTLAANATAQESAESETGVSVGALVFLGPDFRLYHREADSPILIGLRYIDITDDFINEGAAGLPNDSSDKSYTTRTGIYMDYLFNRYSYDDAYYLSAALFQTTKEIKCYGETDDDSKAGLYFGGGYRGSFGKHFGYTIGMLFSPFTSFDLKTTQCSSKENGDFDLNASITYTF